MPEALSHSFQNAPKAGGTAGARPALGQMISQTTQVQDKIAGIGDELLVINTVLKQEIPETLQTGEVAQAIEHSDALETKVQECVDDLAEVNVALEEEVSRREHLEKQLAHSQAELAKSQNAQPSGRG